MTASMPSHSSDNRIFVMTRTFRLLLAGLVLSAASMFAVTLPASAEAYLIRGAKVYTMGPQGVLDKADVLIREQIIVQIAPVIAPPEDAVVIDGTGKIVTPGFMTSYSSLGIEEISAVSETRDDNTSGSSDLSASSDVTYAINPESAVIPVTRIEGITRAVTAPGASSNLWAGQGAVIHLGEAMDLVVKPRAAMFAELGYRGGNLAGGSRPVAWAAFKESLQDARDYKVRWQLYRMGGHRDQRLARVDVDALTAVIDDRRMPIVAHVNRASDILNVLRVAEEEDVDVILLRAREAWRVADRIAEAGVPVILQPFDNLPSRFESLGSRLDNAARLHAAGVTIAFSMFDTHNERLLPQVAGNAVAHGLPYEAALEALTVNPARIWGIDERYGSLEAGKDADLVVWDGDPLEVTSSPDHVFIRGQRMPDSSRQTKLRDRYSDLERGDLPFQYR